MTIHWCGTGLSSVPGLRRLIEDGHDVMIWNRTMEEATDAIGDLTDRIEILDLKALDAALGKDDIVVSMLPADWHLPLAKLCIERAAHFVGCSYISPEMHELDAAAEQAGVRLVNEVGLDPGIDHLMAHWLVADYRKSNAHHTGNALSFTSYCGGVPVQANAFRYKFSWSPIGVLKALKSPSRSIRAFSQMHIKHPWDAISSYTAPLPQPETFEVYPNRDSLPYIAEYHFDPAWRIKEFARGTLRLNGWKDAWADIFTELETLDGDTGEARLQELSDDLWKANAYAKDEPDRVVLCVALKAELDGRPVYHKTYTLDAWGDARGTAMARLVSGTVGLAVRAVLTHDIPAGVTSAPYDPKLLEPWLEDVNRMAQHVQIVDHLR